MSERALVSDRKMRPSIMATQPVVARKKMVPSLVSLVTPHNIYSSVLFPYAQTSARQAPNPDFFITMKNHHLVGIFLDFSFSTTKEANLSTQNSLQSPGIDVPSCMIYPPSHNHGFEQSPNYRETHLRKTNFPLR